MLVLLILSTLLPLIFASEAVDFSTPYTQFPVGCHTFEGLVLCANGGAVLPGAHVHLFEKDPLHDDNLAETPIANAKFSIHACAKDLPTPNLELYLKFENVCQLNTTKTSGILKEGVVMEYIIHDEDQFAHTAINVQ